MKKTNAISISMPAELEERLWQEATRRGVTLSRLITQAVARYLAVPMPVYQKKKGPRPRPQGGTK